jgi:hypothetical protein
MSRQVYDRNLIPLGDKVSKWRRRMRTFSAPTSRWHSALISENALGLKQGTAKNNALSLAVFDGAFMKGPSTFCVVQHRTV